MQSANSAGDWAVMQATHVQGVQLLRAHFVQHSFERHSHEEWCIGVTFAGNQTFRCRGETSTSRQGNVIVFRPDDAHDGHGEDASGFTYAMLYIPHSRIVDWLRQGASRAPDPQFRKALLHDPAIAAELARGIDAATQARESLRGETLLASAVTQLFARHANHRPSTTRERAVPPWVRTVRDYIDANFRDDVKVEELARIAQVSRVHLTRAFTQAYGAAPHALLNTARLRAAKSLLARGASAAETAVQVGYADQSHFVRRFKGAFGVTPGAWARCINGR